MSGSSHAFIASSSESSADRARSTARGHPASRRRSGPDDTAGRRRRPAIAGPAQREVESGALESPAPVVRQLEVVEPPREIVERPRAGEHQLRRKVVVRGRLVGDVLALSRSAAALRDRRRDPRPRSRASSRRWTGSRRRRHRAGRARPRGGYSEPYEDRARRRHRTAALPHNGVWSRGGPSAPSASPSRPRRSRLGPHGACPGAPRPRGTSPTRSSRTPGWRWSSRTQSVGRVHHLAAARLATPGGLQLDAVEAGATNFAQVTPLQCPVYSALVQTRAASARCTTSSTTSCRVRIDPAGANPCR